MKIGIIGGGSIGLLLSSYLCLEHEVTIYVKRSRQKQKINEEGLLLSGKLQPYPIQALLLKEMKDEDCLIICVKQPQVSDILPYTNIVKETTPLLFLQNGMAHTDQIRTLSNPVIIGVVEHGALKKDDRTVIHTGKGRIKLAEFNNVENSINDIVEQLSTPVFLVEKHGDWEQLLAEKLVINAVINPLTAIFNVKNGSIIDNPYLCSLAKEICREVVMVLGLNFSEQWERVETIASNTHKNYSSMLIDMKKDQETEIEAILGYILVRSKKEIPNTSFAYQGIKVLEKEKRINRQNG